MRFVCRFTKDDLKLGGSTTAHLVRLTTQPTACSSASGLHAACSYGWRQQDGPVYYLSVGFMASDEVAFELFSQLFSCLKSKGLREIWGRERGIGCQNESFWWDVFPPINKLPHIRKILFVACAGPLAICMCFCATSSGLMVADHEMCHCEPQITLGSKIYCFITQYYLIMLKHGRNADQTFCFLSATLIYPVFILSVCMVSRHGYFFTSLSQYTISLQYGEVIITSAFLIMCLPASAYMAPTVEECFPWQKIQIHKVQQSSLAAEASNE